MTEDAFWSLIANTANSDAEARLDALRDALSALPIEEIEAFAATLNAKLAVAYTWDLWGADYVIHGGASDDAFAYFRRWLVAQGRAVFEAAVADPDSLADAEWTPGPEGVFEFEEFAYAPLEAWASRTGRDEDEMPFGPLTEEEEPAGEPFDEDEAALASRYPKLWKRYGDQPLG